MNIFETKMVNTPYRIKLISGKEKISPSVTWRLHREHTRGEVTIYKATALDKGKMLMAWNRVMTVDLARTDRIRVCFEVRTRNRFVDRFTIGCEGKQRYKDVS